MVSVNVQLPNEIVQTFGDKITFKQIEKYIIKKNLEKFKNKYYDPINEKYGNFEGEEAISFLKILDYEDKLS